MKTVHQKDLKTGDILLYTPHENDWLGEVICSLTDSPVTHTALMYYDTDHIIEGNSPGMIIGDYKKRTQGRTIYVMRHENASLDKNKVIDIGKMYCDQKTPFAFSNLFILGGYIVIRKTAKSLSPTIQKLLTPLLYIGAGELMKLTNTFLHGKTHAMVCSQFAYHCYKQAGPEYQLHIDKASEYGSLIREIKEMLEKTNESFCSQDAFLEVQKYSNLTDEEKNELMKQLHTELNAGTTNEPFSLTEPFKKAVLEFIRSFAITAGVKTKEELENASIIDVIDAVLDLDEYFVSPGDLLSNCTNANLIGILNE